MSLSFAEPWPILAGLLLAAAVVIYVVIVYRMLAKVVDRGTGLLFLAGRIVASLLLLLLLFEPVLSGERLRTESLGVIVLADRSRSMSIPDSWGGKSRFQVARDFVHREDSGLVPLLGDDFDVKQFGFDSETVSGDPFGEPAAGALTDVAGALRDVGESAARRETVAVVLLSDGADNGGGDARAAAKALGLPVYTVGFGTRGDAGQGRRDLAITATDAPETAFAGNTVVVEVTVRSTGYDLTDPGNRRATVTLSEGDRELASERVEFAEDGSPTPLALRIVPEGKGPRSYRVAVDVRGDEAIPDNNSRTFAVTVMERRASVLYFDATLRWESKFLRDFFARDPAVDLTSVFHSGRGRLVVNGDPHGADLSKGLPATEEGFARFDVIVIGDVEAAVLTREHLDLLRRRIEAGGGLLTLGGYHAYGPGGYAGTPLAEALPVFIAAADGQRESEASLRVSPEGRVHPILSGLAMWFDGNDGPKLRGFTRVGAAKPGAQVLLTGNGGAERRGIVLATQRYGEGRVVTFAGDTTWVWFRSPVFGGHDGFYGRFWGQTLRWLLEHEPEVEQSGVNLLVTTDRPAYRIGETARVRARLRGDAGEPPPAASLTATLHAPEGPVDVALAPVPRTAGHFEARHRTLAPGAYRVTVTARHESGRTETAEAAFTVENDSVEMDRVDLDDVRLTAIARASGGRYYHAPPTAEDVNRDVRRSLVGLLERHEIALSHAPAFFALFVALLGVEWYLRRRRNLI